MKIPRFLSSPFFQIIFITILGYGLLIPFTGFYWDDWPFAWIANFLGPKEFIPAFMPFRPFLGPIFQLTTSLVPISPAFWQVFALIIRLLIGFASWWTFWQIFPSRPGLALTSTLMIVVFPGYSQHWVALTHINQELIPFLLYILSFGYSFKAAASKSRYHMLIAILLQICGLFPTEYFFGMEGLRGLLIFFFIADGRFGQRLKITWKKWLPYILIWALNAVWLFYYYKMGPYNSYDVKSVTETISANLFLEVLDAVWKTGFYIWAQGLILISNNVLAPSSLMAILVAAITFIFFFLSLRNSFLFERSTTGFTSGLLFTGLIGIILGRMPSLAAELPLRLQSSYDRFMISMTMAGVLFIVGMVELTKLSPRWKNIIFFVLISLGVGQQVFNANIFRRDWEQQQNFYSQLSWRIPALEQGTTLLTHQLPIDYETDLSLTAPINWMYAKQIEDGVLPYALLFSEKRLGGPTFPSLIENTPISFNYRTVNFYGTTSKVVVIYMPANGCLRVLDPQRSDERIYEDLPTSLTEIITLSNPSLILTQSATPAAIPPFFNAAKLNSWCYFFTKAELASQNHNYDEVLNFFDQSRDLNLFPQNPYEWFIFIDAYAHNGELKQAEQLSKEILTESPKSRKGLCVTWEVIENSLRSQKKQIQTIRTNLGCKADP